MLGLKVWALLPRKMHKCTHRTSDSYWSTERQAWAQRSVGSPAPPRPRAPDSFPGQGQPPGRQKPGCRPSSSLRDRPYWLLSCWLPLGHYTFHYPIPFTNPTIWT